MPTALTHAAAAVAFGTLYAREPMGEDFWKLSVYSSMLPDADVIGFRFGVRYGDMLGHRGLTHSLPFAVVIGAAAAWWVARRSGKAFKPLWAYFAAVTASHGILDAFTDGGRGVAFFAPFSPARHFFPWTPIAVSPIGVAGVGAARWLHVLGSEFLWVWLPLGTMAAAVAWRRRAAAGSGGKLVTRA